MTDCGDCPFVLMIYVCCVSLYHDDIYYRVEDAQAIIKSSGVGRDLEVKVLRRTQEVTLRVRTTDFLALFRKQQASRRYPELNKSKTNSGGVEQKSSESGDHHKGGNGAATAGREKGEEITPKGGEEEDAAPIELGSPQARQDVDQNLKGHLFVESSV